MADTVNVGTTVNDGTGDPLRIAFQQINIRHTAFSDAMTAQNAQIAAGFLDQDADIEARFNDLGLQLVNRGAWATGAVYSAAPRREFVVNAGQAYAAIVSHTAGASFAADLAAGRWLAVDPAQIIADLQSTATGKGGDLVVYMPPGVGAVATSLSAKLRTYWHSPQDFDGEGDGVADDGQPLLKALQTGRCVLLAGSVYDLGGQTLDVSNSVSIIVHPGARLQNGWLRLRPSDDSKLVHIIGNLEMVDGSVRIAGLSDIAHTDPLEPDSKAVTLVCHNISVTNMHAGATQAVDLWNLKGSTVGVVSVSGSSGIAEAQAILCQDIYDSSFGGFKVNGEYAMGVHFDHSSLRPAFSLCRTKVGFVQVNKPTAFADASGYHGAYLHGAFDSEVGSVTGSGWGGDISSSADFKFRDNNTCFVRAVRVGRMRFTADNNYAFFSMVNRDNVFDDLECSIGMAIVATTPGYHSNNTLRNLRTPSISADGNEAVRRGFVISGNCSIGVSVSGGDINATGLAFENADITLTNSPDFTGVAFNARDALFRQNLSFKPSAASTQSLQGVKVIGDLLHEGSFSAHLLDFSGVRVTGAISVASSGGSRTTTANWANVISDANEIADTTFRPDVKRYRMVAFGDAVYTTLG